MDDSPPGTDTTAPRAYVTRRLLALRTAGRLPDVLDIDVEPRFGYVIQLTYRSGARRIVSGNDLGVDLASSVELARDKGHTKYVLRQMGVACPPGREFLLGWWAASLGRPTASSTVASTVAEATDYVEHHLGYPAFVKPVDGTKGEGVHRVHDAMQLARAIEHLERARARVAVIEAAVDLIDHRIVTLDGDLVCAYRREPATVVGDGTSTVAELVAAHAQRLAAEDRRVTIDSTSPTLTAALDRQMLSVTSVPASGSPVRLSDVANLSAGGTCTDVTEAVHPSWVDLTRRVAQRFGLRLCGLDLLCADIERPDVEHSVLEVSGTPGLEHYAASGDRPRERVDAFYVDVVGRAPG